MKTLIEFFDPPIMRLCFLIALGMSSLAGYNWICWSSLTASDWGTWIGAIGTVGALIGTIVLANSAERIRRREAHDRAIVAAASLMLRIGIVDGSLRFVIDSLSGSPHGVPSHYYTQMVHSIEGAGSWDDSEILPLVVLPNAVAANLAACRTAVKICLDILQKSADDSMLTRQPIPGRAEMLMPYLLAARKSLEIAQRECYTLLNDDAPPIFKHGH